MSSLPASIGTAVALFAATNVDDVVVLTLLSASSRAAGRSGVPAGGRSGSRAGGRSSGRADGRLKRWEIWAGQYAGFAVLVGLSLAAGRGLSLAPARWLWLLALIPFTVGAVALVGAIRAVRRGEEPQAPSAGGLFGVAAITIVDGADNVAAYTPVFATSGGGQIAVTLVVFAVGVALWCAAGSLLVRHHRITVTLANYGHWILPVAFILIALYTLHQTAHVP